MSTRCQVIIKDEHGEIWFYRHSDGYPSCTYRSLLTFTKWLKEGRIRDNIEQAAGWLVLLGNSEYKQRKTPAKQEMSCSSWKVGAYEPSVPRRHGDIEYLYTVNLSAKDYPITYIKIGWGDVKDKKCGWEEYLAELKEEQRYRRAQLRHNKAYEKAKALGLPLPVRPEAF